MSTSSNKIHTESKILDFYTKHLQQFGSTAQGVGWKNDEAQVVRFVQLSKIINEKNHFSINDLGCGTGRYYQYLQSENYRPSKYNGYDILKEMIQQSEENLLPDLAVHLNLIKSAADMQKADYTVASGIFNIKYDARDDDWLQHILETLEVMSSKSKNGFAFNLLTSYSDKEFMQSYLYYADPLFIFDYCKKNFSKNVALLHDYFQYDFTILVRQDSRL